MQVDGENTQLEQENIQTQSGGKNEEIRCFKALPYRPVKSTYFLMTNGSKICLSHLLPILDFISNIFPYFFPYFPYKVVK